MTCSTAQRIEIPQKETRIKKFPAPAATGSAENLSITTQIVTDEQSNVNSCVLPPHEQEIFEATPWKIGNTGKTQKYDYNNDFKMYYRLVDTSKKLFSKKRRVENRPESLDFSGGRNDAMGRPSLRFDPAPASSGATNLSIFSNLPSVQAARKKKSRLNIAYDCEYKRVAGSESRLITSYQFAVYLPDGKTVLEVVFQSLRYDVKNRLYLRTCIGAILSLLISMKAIDVITVTRNATCRWFRDEKIPFFDGSGASYNIQNRFDNINTAMVFESENSNPLVVVDKSALKANDVSEFKKNGIPLDIAIVCHSGVVDLPAFKDDMFAFRKKKGNIIPYLKSMQGGLTSFSPYYISIPTATKYWKFFPVNVLFRDTMCYAPADRKSLAKLGECVGVPKIVLPKGAIGNMDQYMEKCLNDYMAYAAQDALVTLMYGSRLWGVNKDWPVTVTSGACYAMKESIAKYLNINISHDRHGKLKNAEFDRIYRGYKTVNKGKVSDSVGLRNMTNMEAVSYEAKQLHDFAAASYAGGFNTCSIPGVFLNHYTYDFDLENAYPTAMCLVFDIDFENPIEREFKDEDLPIQAFRTPVDPLFCLVDFEFPRKVKYPCIAIHEEGSIIFPRKAQAVYASGPSLYLALKLGAKIHVRHGYMTRIKRTKDHRPSMSLRFACKQMVQDRAVAKKTYGKGSIEELLCKLFVSGSYGKISQDVIEKRTWNGWKEAMEDIGFSAITSPERAAMITDIVRCMLIGTMNQLANEGKNTFSVTTDGFITDATLEEANSVDCFGFRKLFEQARIWLTNGDPTIWAVKHEQGTLINPTTRCNIGLDVPFGKKGVLAHGGVKTFHSEYKYECSKESVTAYVDSIADDDDFGGSDYKDSPADKHRMSELILKRTHRVLYVSREFPNVRDLGSSGTMKDFQTFCKGHQVRLDFDLKRKPVRKSIHDVSGVIDGISFTHSVFDTEPFDTIEEYRVYRDVNKSFSCLRTESDWEKFYLKMNDHKDGYKRHAPDEWTKLVSVIQGYRFGLWKLPELEACRNKNGSMDVKKVVAAINTHNHTNRVFNESAWKNARKPERASQMLPEELLKDLLKEFQYEPIVCAEETQEADTDLIESVM